MTSKRTWFQFSLRGFLIGLTAVCVWLAYESDKARRQQHAVAILDPIATIAYDDDQDPTVFQGLHKQRQRREGSREVGWLETRLGRDYFHRVSSVMIVRQHLRPEHLNAICELHSLRCLGLASCEPVDDHVLAQLRKMPHLYFLSLKSASITDDGLRHLSQFKKLGFLDLTATHVNGKGFRHLKQLPQLRFLYLYATEVSDEHLDDLADLKTLHYLFLQRTHVTAVGVARLRKTLPNCQILWPD